MSKKIVILGGGITGLCTAYWLKKDGIDVTVLEKDAVPGGAMKTYSKDGYLFEYGPNSLLETNPHIKSLVNELGLSDELIYANESAQKRYILRGDELHALPMSPVSFLKSSLFSAKGKLRLFCEPFIKKKKDPLEESISDFVIRRVGREFLDYAINPFVAGVYAGNPDNLSIKEAFPKLYNLEATYGGLVKGMIKGAKERKKNPEKSKQKAKMLSFKKGVQSLPNTLAAQLGDGLKLNTEVSGVFEANGRYNLTAQHHGAQIELAADYVISTLPAPIAADLFRNIDGGLSKHLEDIYYPPVIVLYLGYDYEQVKKPVDGFGYLIPEKEQKLYMGALWNSAIFPGRSEYGKHAFTLFIGGARSPELVKESNEALLDKVVEDFQSTMQIQGAPHFREHKVWKKAIPQYNLGYHKHLEYFSTFEERYKGILLAGNFRGGISVPDCIKNAHELFDRIKKIPDLY